MSFRPIRYSIPPRQADGTRNLKVDEGNRYDTPDTIADLSEHNARYDATCRKDR